jgi:3-oxoacyl-[acyl-carrier protein] reductase
MKLRGKVVLVTGSSRGIGKAIAILFAKEGAILVVNYSKSEKEANEVLKEIKNISNGIKIKCDVSNENQVKKMVAQILKKFGKIDILVNNAGKYIEGDEWDGNSKIWRKTLNDNLISAMNVSKYVAETFQKQKSGVIINIASRYSVLGQYDSLAYSASKAGIVNITQAYSRLLAPFGRANAISPGPVKAGYWLRAPKEEIDSTLSSLPNKRFLEAEEVANLALDLACDEKINGKNILLGLDEVTVGRRGI